jgi:3(or 17)beta-hydroxysteroid dehydrogenase
MKRLEGRTALVTGAAGSIGEAICRRLAAEGAWVAVADIAEDRGVRVARALGDAGFFVRLDVTQEVQWRAAVEIVASQFGGLDILVNNAGILKPATIEEASLDDWRTAMAVNGEGTFLGCKYGVAAMKARGADQGWGAIVNIASTMAIRGNPRHPVYTATKAAVQILSKSVALHCARQGYRIRVNCVLPGAVETDLLRRNVAAGQTEAEHFAEVQSRHPIGRLGKPQDVADAVAFLASDDAAFMTGADLVVDGGATA